MDKKKMRRMCCLMGALLLLMVVVGMWMHVQVNRRNTKTFSESREVFGNPLMGYAPCAWYEKVDEDINLLYVDITWRELEPEEGVYDWEQIEAENQLSRWRREGKHIVLRFVCDIPGEESHMDIPDWLYEKIGGEGTWYDMEYGRGFAPDYKNETFLEYHEKAVAAMGEYLGSDGFVSFVELGSLGHWGEWHVNHDAGIQKLPLADVREQYVLPWITAFPNAKILMRRPFTPAKTYGLGVYNDMTGQPEATEEWLSWLAEGGEYGQTGETDAVVPIPDFWKIAPVGGEFTSSLPMEEMLSGNLKETIGLLKQSHVTFLGPKIAETEYREGYEEVLANLGYRIWISQAKLRRQKGKAALILTWENSGAAPMYEDWPVYVYVEDAQGNTLEKVPVALTLSELLPKETMQTTVVLETEGLLKKGHGGQTVSVGIVDPMTGENAVRLSMDTEQEKGKTIIFQQND